jgi:hypothetical protein
MLWAVGTACFVVLAIVFWRNLRVDLTAGLYRQSLMILIALLAVPMARVGSAPSSLARNRHRA